MKIEANRLALALFWEGASSYLDKETGEIFDEYTLTEKMKSDPDRYERLPQYREGFIRQQYMDKMFAEKTIEDLYGLSAYPKFNITEMQEQVDMDEHRYIVKAHELCEHFGMENTSYALPKTARKNQTYEEFYDAFCLEFAKRWCRKNGFAYFEKKSD